MLRMTREPRARSLFGSLEFCARFGFALSNEWIIDGLNHPDET